MKLVVRQLTTGKFRAYFDGTPNFYGEGDTRNEAIDNLREMILDVLKAIGELQKDM